VRIETDLDISGKVAQFGRGVLGEVSEKILDQFVSQLEASVLSGDAPVPDRPPASATASTEPGPRVIDSPEAQAVDLLDAAGGSVLKRMLPLVLVLVLFAVVRRLRRRR
jgi:hypothetical protein